MDSSDTAIKICFVAPKAYPLFNPRVEAVFGGAEVDLYYLATELAKDRDFDVSFVTADYGQEQIETIEDVRVIKSLDFSENCLTGAVKVWRSLGKADAQMYVIKTISPGMFLLGLYCRLKRKVFLYRTSNTNSCDGTYLRRHRVLGAVYKRVLRRAGKVFVQNKTDKENLQRTTGVRATAIPNGCRIGELPEHQRDTILWAGRSAKIKRPMLFVDLAERVPEEHFTIVCQRATGDDNYETLLRRAEGLENLRFIRHVSFSEIDGYFERAKVLVNTSDAEGFPNTFIQAGLYAVPILSLNVNPDGFLNEYKCGICCDGDPEQLVNELGLLLEGDKYIEMGKNARSYVEKNHDIKIIVEQYKQLLRKLV